MLILQVLIGCAFALKLTFLTKRARGIMVFLCMLFTVCSIFWTVDIPLVALRNWLGDAHNMQNVAVCIVLDVSLQWAFCFLTVHVRYSGIVSRPCDLAYRVLRAFPGILFFGVVFLSQVELLSLLPGHSFWGIACVQALLVFLFLVLFNSIWERMFPQLESRLEILFLLEVLLVILGITATTCGTNPL